MKNDLPHRDADHPIHLDRDDVASLVSWRDVPLYWLDSARALTDSERIKILTEYRETDGMYLVVMAEPTGSESPEEYDRLSGEGPDVDGIDWTGFAQVAS